MLVIPLSEGPMVVLLACYLYNNLFTHVYVEPVSRHKHIQNPQPHLYM